MSIRWHILDFGKEAIDLKSTLFHLLQLGPVWRSFRLITVGNQLNREPSNINFNIFKAEEADIGVINLVHTFTHSAPQLTWQIFIIWKMLLGTERLENGENIEVAATGLFINVAEQNWPLIYRAL